MTSSLKPIALAAAALAFFCASAHAAFWRCELPGGVFMVSLPTVSLVSVHEYVVDGAARVTELTVGTNTAVVARFYYIEPLVPKSPVGIGQSLVNKAQEKAQDASSRTGMEAVWQKVVKNYPATTHAHTVEFRLENLEQLERIQKSLETAWRNNTETQIKIAEDA